MMVKGVMIVLVIKGVIIMRSNSDLKFYFLNWVIPFFDEMLWYFEIVFRH